jgi:hypothetical protein
MRADRLDGLSRQRWMINYTAELPQHLQRAAFRAGAEAAWGRAAALEVIRVLSSAHLVVCGVEIWLVAAGASRIPSPIIYGWTAPSLRSGEGWDDYVERTNRLAGEYAEAFAWDESDRRHASENPLFNLEIISRAERDFVTE